MDIGKNDLNVFFNNSSRWDRCFPKNPDGSDSRWRWGKERVEQEKKKLEWIKRKQDGACIFAFISKIVMENRNSFFKDSVGTNRTSKKRNKRYIWQ